MKRIMLLFASLLIASGVLLAAPASEGADAIDGGATQFEGIANVDLSDWERGTPGGRFIKASFVGDPKSFNPVVAKEVSTTDVTDNLYLGAVRRNQITLE